MTSTYGLSLQDEAQQILEDFDFFLDHVFDQEEYEWKGRFPLTLSRASQTSGSSSISRLGGSPNLTFRKAFQIATSRPVSSISNFDEEPVPDIDILSRPMSAPVFNYKKQNALLQPILAVTQSINQRSQRSGEFNSSLLRSTETTSSQTGLFLKSVKPHLAGSKPIIPPKPRVLLQKTTSCVPRDGKQLEKNTGRNSSFKPQHKTSDKPLVPPKPKFLASITSNASSRSNRTPAADRLGPSACCKKTLNQAISSKLPVQGDDGDKKPIDNTKRNTKQNFLDDDSFNYVEDMQYLTLILSEHSPGKIKGLESMLLAE